MDPKYLRGGVPFCAAHAAEEAGELVAALGKLLRWGGQSVNPELPRDQQEKNIDWVRREFADLCGAMERLEKAYADSAPIEHSR